MQMICRGHEILSTYDDNTNVPVNPDNGEYLLKTDLRQAEIEKPQILNNNNVARHFKNIDEVFSLEELKAMKIASMKEYHGNQIRSKYPEWKQININRQAPGTSKEDIEAMHKFIDDHRDETNQKEEAMSKMGNIKDIAEYNFYT